MKAKPTTLIIISTIFFALTCRIPANIHAGATEKHRAGRTEQDGVTGPADKNGGATRKGEDAVVALKQRGIYETIRAQMEATRYEITKNQAGGRSQA